MLYGLNRKIIDKDVRARKGDHEMGTNRNRDHGLASYNIAVFKLCKLRNDTSKSNKLLEKCISVIPLTLRRLMSYIYEAPILDVSRSHTTTQHSR